MFYLLSAVIGYLLGSIPTAYLVLKGKGIDITEAGTGNVGAMNSYEVTNSKYIGIFVFMADAIKGLLSAYIPLLLFPFGFEYAAFALLFAVLSHCFNPWLGFKGGRGLAAALGGALLITPFLAALWIAGWVLSFLVKRDILLGNIVANTIAMIVPFCIPTVVFRYAFPKPDSVSSLMFFIASLMIIIFIKHIDPMMELLTKLNLIKRTK
jgi:glycerol-3-phosphate acyltransferase PlsY